MVDRVLRMGGDAQEHVTQVLERWNASQTTALDERVEERGTVSAGHAACEEPVLSAFRSSGEASLTARST